MTTVVPAGRRGGGKSVRGRKTGAVTGRQP